MNYLSSGVSGLLRFTLVNLLRNWVVNFNRGRWSVYSGICGQFTPFFPTTLTIKGKKVKIGDDVSALGLVFVYTDPKNGEMHVHYRDEMTETASVTIEINPITKKIIEIYYVLY